MENLPLPGCAEESFTDLFRSPGLRIERIVSRGHCSPEDFWYDQEEDEWVLLAAGEAVLEFIDPAETIILTPTSWAYIPAGRKHRVVSTSDPAIWLAIWLPKNAPERDTELD